MATIFRKAIAMILLLSLSIGPSPVIPVTGAAMAPIPKKYYFPVINSPTEFLALGPDGGSVTPVVFDSKNPVIAYAGTWGAGIFKSSDGGATWTSISTGLGNLLIQAILINPQNSNILYAGTYKSGVYKSTDAGANWFSASSGLNLDAIVYALVIDPGTPDTVYAGTRSPGSNPPWGGGVYKTTDGGKSWANSTNNLAEDWVYGLAVDSRNPQTIYAATHSKGVGKTTDGGRTWKMVNNGLYDQSGRAVAIDPSNSQIVYAGMWHGSGVFKTTNGGQSWTVMNSGLNGAKIIAITVDPVKPSTLYALSYLNGVYKSTDGAKSWSADGLWPDYVFSLTVDPRSHDHLLASGVSDALFSSVSGGTAWINSSRGLHATTVTATTADPSVPGMIYAGLNGQGIFRSTDNGLNWSPANGGLSDLNIRSMAAISGAVLAGTNSGGIFRSTNNGLDWQPANQGLPMADAKAIADNPLMDRYLTWGPAEDLALEGISATGWDAVLPKAASTAPIMALALAPSNQTILYAGTLGNGVFRSINSGASWAAAGLGGRSILSLAVDRANPAILYAGSDPGGGTLWKSTDSGKTWVQIQTGIAGLHVNGLSASGKAGTVFAGTENGVYQSNNSGANWTKVGLNGANINAILVHPQSSQLVIAGANNGVFISRDGGATWKPFDQTLINPQVWTLATGSTSSKYLYIGTQASGLYRYKMAIP